MRRSDKEIKDRGQIDAIIRKAEVCRIGLSDNGTPYIVPVSFGYKDNCIFFHAATAGRKLDIIRQNNRVCFEIDTDHELVTAKDACGFSYRYRSVMGTGKATILNGVEEKRAGLDAVMQHYRPGAWSFPDDRMAKTVVVRIEIESLTGKANGYKDSP